MRANTIPTKMILGVLVARVEAQRPATTTVRRKQVMQTPPLSDFILKLNFNNYF